MEANVVTTRSEPFFLGNVFQKVERAKQQWESTVDALPELICMVDGDQKIIRANRTLERWQLGKVREIAGRDFHSVVHPDCDDPACYQRCQRRRESGQHVQGAPPAQAAPGGSGGRFGRSRPMNAAGLLHQYTIVLLGVI